MTLCSHWGAMKRGPPQVTHTHTHTCESLTSGRCTRGSAASHTREALSNKKSIVNSAVCVLEVAATEAHRQANLLLLRNALQTSYTHSHTHRHKISHLHSSTANLLSVVPSLLTVFTLANTYIHTHTHTLEGKGIAFAGTDFVPVDLNDEEETSDSPQECSLLLPSGASSFFSVCVLQATLFMQQIASSWRLAGVSTTGACGCLQAVSLLLLQLYTHTDVVVNSTTLVPMRSNASTHNSTQTGNLQCEHKLTQQQGLQVVFDLLIARDIAMLAFPPAHKDITDVEKDSLAHARTIKNLQLALETAEADYLGDEVERTTVIHCLKPLVTNFLATFSLDFWMFPHGNIPGEVNIFTNTHTNTNTKLIKKTSQLSDSHTHSHSQSVVRPVAPRFGLLPVSSSRKPMASQISTHTADFRLKTSGGSSASQQKDATLFSQSHSRQTSGREGNVVGTFGSLWPAEKVVAGFKVGSNQISAGMEGLSQKLIGWSQKPDINISPQQ
eukprot:GHVR01024929.1.p1 GENE.GHVR01024929.1~~GHVR01024929.1.p1  ORF type:complete len:498 (-),score=99.51 GHVR01024929.1:1739-3232(-)